MYHIRVMAGSLALIATACRFVSSFHPVQTSNRMSNLKHVYRQNRAVLGMIVEKEETASFGTLPASSSRRGFVKLALIAGAVGSGVIEQLGLPEEARANGMLDVPPLRLNNRYFLLRAGQGGSDKEGLIQSHPIEKLHQENGLTEQGVQEVQRAASVLRSLGVDNAFIWADISSRAQQTARIMAQELNIRQERIVPEFSFLDPRGMGEFDGKDVATFLPQIYKADANNLQWRPPPNTDGTPHESVNDVFVRVRQLMSKLETQYQGEDVVLVGADSDCLSILQAFILGEELGTHSRYYLRPGEGRQLKISSATEYNYDSRKKMRQGVFGSGTSSDEMEMASTSRQTRSINAAI